MSFRDVIREKKGGPTDSSSPSSLTTNNNNNIKKQAMMNNATNTNTNNTTRSSSKQQQQQTFKSSNLSSNLSSNNQNSDQEEEFSEICSEIEKLLSEINKATLSIQKSTTTILGSNKDTHEHRESLSLIIKKSSQKVESLSNLILKFEHYELLFKNSNLHLKKIQKLKNQMDQILKEYKKQTTNCLITQKETLQQFQKNQEYLKQDENSRLLNNSNYGNNNTSNYGNYQSNKLEYDEEFENEVEFNTKILIEREKDILEVESSIREINGIFKELHFLTIQQDEDLGLIEDRIEETSIRIEQGKENIVKAEKHSKIGRNLFCILLLIFLALGAAIAIVLIVLKVIGII